MLSAPVRLVQRAHWQNLASEATGADNGKVRWVSNFTFLAWITRYWPPTAGLYDRSGLSRQVSFTFAQFCGVRNLRAHTKCRLFLVSFAVRSLNSGSVLRGTGCLTPSPGQRVAHLAPWICLVGWCVTESVNHFSGWGVCFRSQDSVRFVAILLTATSILSASVSHSCRNQHASACSLCRLVVWEDELPTPGFNRMSTRSNRGHQLTRIEWTLWPIRLYGRSLFHR